MRSKPAQVATRARRARAEIRTDLLEAALIEFGAKGFDGASTHAIARRADAHQPQINYHFESKHALWVAAVDHLFGLLRRELDGLLPARPAELEAQELAEIFADAIHRLVRFVAEHPQLNQIMVHEGTAPSDRLTWMTQTHVRPFYDALQLLWQLLRDAGVAAAVDGAILYYNLVGAASLPYVNAPEVRLLTGRDPGSKRWIREHSDSLVAIFLPGLEREEHHGNN